MYLYIKWFKNLAVCTIYDMQKEAATGLTFTTITIVLIFMMMKFSEYCLYRFSMTILLSTISV